VQHGHFGIGHRDCSEGNRRHIALGRHSRPDWSHCGSGHRCRGQHRVHWFQDGPRRRLEDGRTKLLLQMLRDGRFQDRWRKLSTLSRVVGADEDSTKRLLIDVGARGSEKDDGLWGLIESHPFDQVDR
jgi:hypothetical protein